MNKRLHEKAHSHVKKAIDEILSGSLPSITSPQRPSLPKLEIDEMMKNEVKYIWNIWRVELFFSLSQSNAHWIWTWNEVHLHLPPQRHQVRINLHILRSVWDQEWNQHQMRHLPLPVMEHRRVAMIPDYGKCRSVHIFLFDLIEFKFFIIFSMLLMSLLLAIFC